MFLSCQAFRNVFKYIVYIYRVQVTYRGTYRKVFVRPEDLTWKIEEYTDEKLPLFLEDVPSRKKEETHAVKEETKENAEVKKENVEVKKEEVEQKDGATETPEVKQEEKKPGKFANQILIYRLKGYTTVT